MGFLTAEDILELKDFAEAARLPRELIARITEYVDLMVVISGRTSHPIVKELDVMLKEMNARAGRNRPPGSKIPLSYLLTMQHLPLMRSCAARLCAA